ncbi:MAG: CoA transferase [Marinobacter sp.]|nr:CoA transferase [Marinobacter sp.]
MPLEGVRVLELGSLIAGPYAASLLAQFGANVIKIEPPGTGDPTAALAKNAQKIRRSGGTPRAATKSPLTLNLKDPGCSSHRS